MCVCAFMCVYDCVYMSPPYTLSDALSSTVQLHISCVTVMLIKSSIMNDTFASAVREMLPGDVIMDKHSPVMTGLFTTSRDPNCNIPKTVHEG